MQVDLAQNATERQN